LGRRLYPYLVLGQYSDYRRVFIEVTKTAHQHGGVGWEFGTCLWSPSRNKADHDLYRIMREPRADDLVLHILEHTWESGGPEHRFAGRSVASGTYDTRSEAPPLAGDWANQAPYYRVPLRGYAAFPEPISVRALIDLYEGELRDELKSQPTYYPFTLYARGTEVRLRQGGYLNNCTPGLFQLVQIGIGEGPLPPRTPPLPQGVPLADADQQHKETKRLAGERYACARNPGLVKAARAIRGFTCEACDFDFEATYGSLGHEYIECHHVDPLGGRNEPNTSTSVRDVRMLCANCHRMVHRERPPVRVEVLRSKLGLGPRAPICGL
jgi:hypothetical protein